MIFLPYKIFHKIVKPLKLSRSLMISLMNNTTLRFSLDMTLQKLKDKNNC